MHHINPVYIFSEVIKRDGGGESPSKSFSAPHISEDLHDLAIISVFYVESILHSCIFSKS